MPRLKDNQGEFFDHVKLYLDNQLKTKFKGQSYSVHPEK